MNTVKVKKTIWDKIIRVGAVLWALVILVSAVKGVISFVTERVKRNQLEFIDKTALEIKVDSLLKLIPQVETMQGALKDLSTKEETNAKQTKLLNKGLSDHLQASKTNNEYIQWLELQLDKSNDTTKRKQAP